MSGSGGGEALELLASLHGGELSAEAVSLLRLSNDAILIELAAAMPRVDATTAGEAEAGVEIAERLAADYASIYHNFRLQISPCGSWWRDDDSLLYQEEMFALRDLCQQYGLAASDWQKLPEDHISCQLQLLAHLLRLTDRSDEPELCSQAHRDALRLIDDHLLPFLPNFAARLDAARPADDDAGEAPRRLDSHFYPELAALTLAVIEMVSNDGQKTG